MCAPLAFTPIRLHGKQHESKRRFVNDLSLFYLSSNITVKCPITTTCIIKRKNNLFSGCFDICGVDVCAGVSAAHIPSTKEESVIKAGYGIGPRS